MIPRWIALPFALALTHPAIAKPVADYPDSVSFTKTTLGPIYTNKARRTLYAMSVRGARARSGIGAAFCSGPCAQIWTPLKPAAGAKPLGSWTVIDGANGPQWAYDRNPVFTFNADRKPGDVNGQAYDDLWLAIPYIPPKPAIIAPSTVEARLVDGAYILADAQGHALYTAPCTAKCGTPFAAGMASLPLGDWSVLRDQDGPQWAWRGKPVFVSDTQVPAGGKMLKP